MPSRPADRPPLELLAPWLRQRFGQALHRVALDAGSTCPNRDGTRGRGGCVYCDVEGSGTGALKSGLDIGSQLRLGLERIARRGPDVGAIAYFQSYSNTYVAPERLDEVLAAVEPWLDAPPEGLPPIRVLALATRPDTLPEWALARLERLASRVPVWLELGLEAADDGVLERIHRLHSVAEFEDAVARAQARGLAVVGHAILGLPGDGRAGARRTAEVLARSGVEGVKVHHLLVLRRTVLERWWRDQHSGAKDHGLELLTPETYVDWLADFVERLRPEQVLHRLTADAPPGQELAPRWTVAKEEVRQRLIAELQRRGNAQGSHAGRSGEGPLPHTTR
jgi:radical SAM protein (TIGR01212 family)